MMTKCKLSPLALGLALGTFAGLSVLLFTLLTFLGFENAFVTSMHKMNVHLNYEATIFGIIGVVLISFLEGLVRGAVLAFFYNMFVSCCCSKSDKCH